MYFYYDGIRVKVFFYVNVVILKKNNLKVYLNIKKNKILK